MTNCFSYLKSSKLQSFASYPYTGKASACQYNSAQGVVGVNSYTEIKSGDVNAMLNAVARQPLAVGVASSSGSFFSYKSGILDTTGCGTKLTHAVNIIGYGT